MPAKPTCAAVLAIGLLTGAARADGVALRPDAVKASDIKLDGIPREWPSAMTPLSRAVSGRARVSMRGAAVYDDASLYIAGEFRDDKLVRTSACGDAEDHAALLIAFPRVEGGYDEHEIRLYPGEPGKTAGCVKTKAGTVVAGARIVEAPKGKGGYTFEAVIPWASFPEAARVRVGLRAALRYVDGDGQSVKAVIATSTESAAAGLPAFPLEAEQLLDDGLLKEKGLKGAPIHDRVADVAGDAQMERVLFYDRYLVVVGPHFRGGKEYYFSDMGEPPVGTPALPFDVRDVNGDGKAELIVHKRTGTPTQWREVLLVMAMGTGEAPFVMFQHEIGLHAQKGTVENQVTFGAQGGRPTIELTAGAVTGFSADNYREPVETSMEPVLLPWSVRSQVYQWNGKVFEKLREERKAGAVATSAPAAEPTEAKDGTAEPAAASAQPPTADELQEQVYALYRREHRVPAAERPRFDVVADVAEDHRRERIVLHGRDLVVFGKGYRGGSGYSFLTLQPFSDPRDVLDVTPRDLTGDGQAEVVVRGIMRVPAPRQAGLKRGATLDREVLFVYTVTPKGLVRAFGAETARVIGPRRVQGSVAFVAKGRAVEIEMRPGRAFGFTEATYPFNQESSTPGGLVPVLLPWGGAAPLRFHWDGSAFVR